MDVLRILLSVAGGALAVVILRQRASWKKSTTVMTTVVAVAFAALACYLWLAPRYEVELVRSGKPVLVGETGALVATVRNSGLLGGTFSATYALDGIVREQYLLTLAGRSSCRLALPLPHDLERGRHTVMVGNAAFSFDALRPPTLITRTLQLSRRFAVPGQRVVVNATVANAGDLPGELTARLLVNGVMEDVRTLNLDPGEERFISLWFRKLRAGKFTVRLANKSRRFWVVRPIRFANGAVVERRIWGGLGKITVKNDRGPKDGMFVLTRPQSRAPLLAVYVRAHQNATVTGIPNGRYWAYYWVGSYWNKTTDGFLVTRDRGRYKGTLEFSTQSWTTSWSDYYYVYTQRHTRYSHYVLSLYSVRPGSGNTVATVPVSERGFPKPR